MYQNMARTHLISLLALILPQGYTIKSSVLLKAFATFYQMDAMKENTDLNSAYSYVCKANAAYTHGFCANFIQIQSEEFSHIKEQFLRFDLLSFLRFIVPDFAAQPQKLCDFYKQNFNNELIKFVHYMCRVRQLGFKKLGNYSSEKGSESKHVLYSSYCKIEAENITPLSEKDFFKLYNYELLYPLSFPKTKILPGNKKYINDFVTAVKSELMLSNSDQIDLLHNIIFNNLDSAEAPVFYFPARFSKIKSGDRQHLDALNTCVISALKVSPLELLSELSVSKKPQPGNAKTGSEGLKIRNDIPLSTGLIYNLFSSLLPPFDDESKSTDIFFPSLFFFKQWISDSLLNSKKVNFIFKDKRICDLINYNFSYDSGFAAPLSDNISLYSYDEWKQAVETKQLCVSPLCLLFSVDATPAFTKEFFELLNGFCSCDIQIFNLISNTDFRKFLSEAPLEHIRINGIDLIPQGINNCTLPSRKLFVYTAYCPSDTLACDSACIINSYRLNHDLGSQALSQSADFLSVTQSKLQRNIGCFYESINQMFRQEVLKRRAAGRTKSAAFSYQFTPDITIWCSRSYPEKNSGRPRLEAYVCEPPSYDKASRGYMNRGRLYPETKKRVCKITDDEVDNWLEHIYPFETVQPRRSSGQMQDSGSAIKPVLNIREFIIEKYSEILSSRKSEIALKTFWYLFPNLSDDISPSDYECLSSMMYTDIGMIALEDVSIEECEKLLTAEYPECSREALWRKFKLLEYLISSAVSKGWCNENPLHTAIQERHTQDKLFSQVRSALIKKHFTKAEARAAFQFIKEKFNSGNFEYMGVMIRLLTGLESNIVCALRYSDIKKISDFNIYQLSITRQLTNDGSQFKGFADLSDYRLVPLIDILHQFTEQYVQYVKIHFPNTKLASLPLVGTISSIADSNTRYKFYEPRKLDRLCGEVLESLGIDERIITVPTANGGTKETNLNYYGGDFFRENFRFHALNSAKLSTDELAYLLGNKPETTLGKHYWDFANNASQYLIYVKLQRLAGLFSNVKSCTATQYHFSGSDSLCRSFSVPGSQPLSLIINLLLKDGVGNATLDISCDNGMTTYMTEISEKQE